MKMTLSAAFSQTLRLLVLLAASRVSSASRPSNGDIRLVNGTGYRNPTQGLPEIFLSSNGTWGTVCVQSDVSRDVSINFSNTVCQQLGYTGAVPNSMSIINESSDDFPPASPLIKDVQCNAIYPHILRCQYMLVTDIMEDICDDSCGIPYITCIDTNLTSPANYSGQVALFYGEWSSQGLLQVYLNDRWGTVCSEFFTQSTADAACQQLGYTNALYYTTYSKNEVRFIWLRSLNGSCNSSCFTDCYKAPTIRNIYCSNIADVYLVCTFDPSQYDSTLIYGGQCKLMDGKLSTPFIAILMVLFCLIVSIYIIIFITRVLVAAYHKTEHYKKKDNHHRRRNFDEYRSTLDQNSLIISDEYTVTD